MSFYTKAKVIVAPLAKLFFGIRCINPEAFPVEETVIVAANHTSLIDPVILGSVCKKQLYFMAKAELFKFKTLGALIGALGAFPVKRGRRDNDSMDRAKAIIAEGKIFSLFPQGTRMPRRENPEDARPGVALFASESNVGVLPIYIYNKRGKATAFTRNVVVIGEVVPASEFSGESMAQLRESSAMLLAKVFALKEKVPEKWR